jgi:hypothetical protein
LKTVPVVVADYLTPEQVAASRLADNKSTQSEWDMELLTGELQALLEMDIDLDLTGFEEHERQEIMDLGRKTSLRKPEEKRERILGQGQVRVRPVLALEDVAIFERALKATGEINRGRALVMICEAYLGKHESAKGQFDVAFKDLFEAKPA